MKYRLKETHPDFLKLQGLFEYMDKEEIRIWATNYKTVVKIGKNEYTLQDTDNPDLSMDDLPPACEWKLTFNKD